MTVMSQLLRQIGVVVGLTVILTFPVTVVSGAGLEKPPDHVARVLAVTGWKGQVHGAVVMAKAALRSMARMSPGNEDAQFGREGEVCNNP